MDSSWPETLQSNRHKVIDELVQGEESAKQLRKLLHKASQGGGTPSSSASSSSSSSSSSVSAQELVHNVLRSFTNTLSILHCDASDQVSQVPIKSCVKSEESEESSRSISPPRDRRGCYKRRKNCESEIKLTSTLADDGYQWRKYGQKSIMHSEYPRNYFRCTHKIDQGCQATKQVQMVSKNPPKYRITYHGHHTCRNIIQTPQIFLDTSCPNDSSFYLSFSNQETTPHKANNFSFGSCFASFPRKQEGGSDNNNNTGGQTQRSSSTAAARIQSSSSEFHYSTDEATVFESHGGDMTVLSSSLGSDQGDVVSSSAPDNFDIDILEHPFDDDAFQQYIMKI